MERPSVLGIVSYRIFPAQMGGQKCVDGLYRHLAAHTKVVLAASKDNKEIKEVPYTVLPFLFDHWKGALNLFYVFRLRKLMVREGIDLIMVEHSYFGWLALLLRRLTKKPVVIRSHNIEAHRFRDMRRNWWRLYAMYERWVHRRVDHTFFITSEDRDWAIRHWHLKAARCSVLGYGVDLQPDAFTDRRVWMRQQLLNRYQLRGSMRLFFFNGSFDYPPNIDALRIIITELIPLLRAQGMPVRIVVCGKGLDHQWEEVLRSYNEIIYAGFVTDIDNYFYGTDCFINPLTLGAGLRIKLVEALAHGQTAISTRDGARGIETGLAGDKLVLVNDYDWPGFVSEMLRPDLNMYGALPSGLREAFNWNNIVQQALLSLRSL